jgi:hypothetical protein
MFPEFRKWKTKLTENENFRFFAANGRWEGKLLFVCCKWKWKTEANFPWSANDK